MLCGDISCEPFKVHSPVTPYYVLYHDWAGSTKIPHDRCLCADSKSVRMEYALQMSDVDIPTWYEKALSSLGFSGRDVCDECSGFAMYAINKLYFSGVKTQIESDSKPQLQCQKCDCCCSLVLPVCSGAQRSSCDPIPDGAWHSEGLERHGAHLAVRVF